MACYEFKQKQMMPATHQSWNMLHQVTRKLIGITVVGIDEANAFFQSIDIFLSNREGHLQACKVLPPLCKLLLQLLHCLLELLDLQQANLCEPELPHKHKRIKALCCIHTGHSIRCQPHLLGGWAGWPGVSGCIAVMQCCRNTQADQLLVSLGMVLG